MNVTREELRQGKGKGAREVRISDHLEEFPGELYDLVDTLEILDLSGNRLRTLPDDLDRFSRIRIIFASQNEFTEFPRGIGRCSSLEMVGFKSNRIEKIPEDAFPPKLRWLILTDNRLESLPENLGQCRSMQKLMLAGNRLTSLPDLSGLQNLELLRISANRLESLPGWVFTLPRLAWLAFSGNPFCQIPYFEEIGSIEREDLELLDLLGEGASGEIYRAHWISGGREVAVKLFRGEVTSDGYPLDEKRATMAAGSHPGLSTLLGRIAGLPYGKEGLVFTLIPPEFRVLGGPPDFETCTRDIFDAKTRFSFSFASKVAIHILEVMEHLHRRGILHGDLYAHNTLVRDEGETLFTDFGAASFFDAEGSDSLDFRRIEWRAFAIFLEDLFSRTEVFSGSSEESTVQKILNTVREGELQDSLDRDFFHRILSGS